MGINPFRDDQTAERRAMIERALQQQRIDEQNRIRAEEEQRAREQQAQQAFQEELGRKQREEEARRVQAEQQSRASAEQRAREESDRLARERASSDEARRQEEARRAQETSRSITPVSTNTSPTPTQPTGPSQEELARQAEADRRASWQSTRDRKGTEARRFGEDQIAAYGVPDKWGLMDRYKRDLESAEADINPYTDEYGAKVNKEAIWENARSGILNRERGGLLRNYESQFANGFERKGNYFTDETDDALIGSILGEQRTEAQANVDRAKARGVLGEAGSTFAAKELSAANSRGNSSLQTMGQGVLDRYRSGLTAITNPVRDRATQWNFGDNLDLDAVRGEVDSRAGSYKGRLEGDLRNVLGDTKFFDTDLILGRGGAQDPASNIAGSAVLGAAFNADPKKDKDKEKNGLLTNVGAI